MKKIALSKLGELFAAISENQTLILPVESAGQVDFGVWSPEALSLIHI